MKKHTTVPLLTLLCGLVLGYFLFSHSEDVAENLASPSGLRCAGDGEIVYTCAMHPQVKQPEKGRCPLCTMPLISKLDKTYMNPSKLKMSLEAVALTSVRTERVKKGGTGKTIRLGGRVVPDEKRVFHQVAHLPGRIDKLYVHEEGEYVRKGQPIASIYSRELIGMLETFEYSKNSAGVLRSAINNIKGWNVSDEQLKAFDIESGDYYKPVTVLSDFNGVVLKKYISEGDRAANDYMADATRLFDIADLSRVWVLFDVYERDLGWVKKGDEISFTVSSYSGKVFRGNVARIAPAVNPATRTISVRIEVDNREALLKPEMLAIGQLKASRHAVSAQLQIPKTAVLWTGKRSVVYVKDPKYYQPVFEYREVVIGGDLGEHYLIAEGLEEGEEVVVNGAFSVDSAAQLAGKKSMMSPQAKKKPRTEAEFARN